MLNPLKSKTSSPRGEEVFFADGGNFHFYSLTVIVTLGEG